MNDDLIVNGLLHLGFISGWVVQGDEITLWENNAPQPTKQEILAAAKLYKKPEPTIDEKLASVGLNLNDLKTALGL